MYKRTIAALALGSIVFLTAACNSMPDNTVAAPTTTTTEAPTTTTTEAPTTTTTEAPTTTTTRPRPVTPTTTSSDFSSDSSDPDVFEGFCHWTADGGVHWSELSVQSDCKTMPGFKAVWTHVPKGYNEASPEQMLKMNPADYSYGDSSSSCYIPGTYVPGVTVGDTYVPGVYVPGVDAC